MDIAIYIKTNHQITRNHKTQTMLEDAMQQLKKELDVKEMQPQVLDFVGNTNNKINYS